MKKPHIPQVREALRAHPDGLTIKEIRALVPAISRRSVAHSVLRKMPDAYIDRWILTAGNRGQYEAIWRVVVPPPHCPHPQGRYYDEPVQTVWRTI